MTIMNDLKSRKVAVIGAGPAGFYAALELLKRPSIQVDVIDKLPTPFGLVRYGIAPDNQRMKTVSKVFSGLFDESRRLRFIGNVDFGTDLARDDVLDHYDSVVYATGAPSARLLGVAGENLPGSFSAKDFVDWYNGHPFRDIRDFSLDFAAVAVVGGGNVALDIARMLANEIDVVRSTDVPDDVLKAFEGNAAKDIYLLVRKGPVQAKFTPVELRGLGNLRNVDVIVDPKDLVFTEEELAYISGNQQCRTNIDIFKSIAKRPLRGHEKRIFIKFWCSVAEIGGEQRVQWLKLRSNRVSVGNTQETVGKADMEKIPVDAVFSAIGQIVRPLRGVPFDERKSVIPNVGGQVVDQNGKLLPGEFVSGWAKRGPSGTVGTNREDSKQTVNALLESWEGPHEHTPRRGAADITELLRQRGVRFTCWQDWLRIDEVEVAAGAEQGRIRAKLSSLSGMMGCLKNGPPGLPDGSAAA
ncbi:MAG: NADP oxidoreductase [Candidimonas sp.]|nr:MAG: NADP oxidoreductase [Candidimonas sp.]